MDQNFSEEKKLFLRHLQEFWASKGVNNLKIPQIGGRELDLHHLYKSVCARGGAQFVSTNKLWKDIVSEFGLPPSCTSASFTLRNHYQKYLLSYEQKFLFGKDDQQAVRELVGSRQRKSGKNIGMNMSQIGGGSGGVMGDTDQDMVDVGQSLAIGSQGLGGLSQPGLQGLGLGMSGIGNGGTTSSTQNDLLKQLKPSFQNQQNTSSLGPNQVFSGNIKNIFSYQRPSVDLYNQSQNIKQDFKKSPHSNAMANMLWDKYNKTSNDEIYYTKKSKIVPTVNEMKRIMLAFESHLQEEILYALNSLLLYSFNTFYPLLFDYYPELLNNMANYLEFIMNNTPYVNKQLTNNLNQFVVNNNIKKSMYQNYSGNQINYQQQQQQQQSQQIDYQSQQQQNINQLQQQIAQNQQQQQQSTTTSQQQFQTNSSNQQQQIGGGYQQYNQQQQQSSASNANNNYTNTSLNLKLNVMDNYNYSIVDILQHNSESPIKYFYQNQENQIQMKYDMASELELLEQIRTILQILRNASFVKPNELTIFKNEKVFNIILKLFINITDKEIQRNTLDLISNISKNIFINNLNSEITSPKQFCNKLSEFLCPSNDTNNYSNNCNGNQTEQIEAAIDSFRKLVIIQENETILETILYANLENFVKLLVSPSFEIREGVLELLCFLSDLKMSTRLGIAKQPRCIMRLIALMSSGTLKNNQKTSKLCALILNNISLAPASKFYFLPYERDLFLIAATDDQVSKIISNVLGDLDNLVSDDYEVEGDVASDELESMVVGEEGQGEQSQQQLQQSQIQEETNITNESIEQNVYENSNMNIEQERDNFKKEQNNPDSNNSQSDLNLNNVGTNNNEMEIEQCKQNTHIVKSENINKNLEQHQERNNNVNQNKQTNDNENIN